MRRIVPILLSIFIGALAVAVGMGIYLHKANADRERLAMLASQAERLVSSIQEKQDHAITEANKKLDDANVEVAKAQAALKILEEERKLMATATLLPMPKPAQLRGWKDAINLQLGASLKYPSAETAVTMDAQGLTLERANTSAKLLPSADTRWFSLVRWDERLEQELISTFTTSTSVSYFANGRLLVGRVGMIASSDASVFVLKVRAHAATFLIWAKDPDKLTDHKTIMQVLATLDFPS